MKHNGGRPRTGMAKRQVSCRVSQKALKGWLDSGGRQLSVDLAAAFEAKYEPLADQSNWLEPKKVTRENT